MNFKTFSVATTTIFPISNSVSGGQLVTEWNLRSRDFVPSWSEIDYDSAASYVHDLDDFKVRVEQDDSGVVLSNSTLELLPGTAILNGHYVKQEGRMLVDLLEGNKELQLRGEEPMTGKLAVGLRVYYSTESTMVGAMAAENEDDVYEGVQVVVMPKSKLITPMDSPKDKRKVNCHLKLAEFTFLDNEIRGIVNNSEKLKMLDAERISNIEKVISSNYLSRDGVNPKKLYVLAGKSVNGTINDTWCDATDSLFVWDKNPKRTKTKPSVDHAQFVAKDTGETSLVLPHKNIDGMKITQDEKNPDYGKDEYYEAVTLDLPEADFSTNTPGTVTPAYTKRIKAISGRVDEFFHLLKGKQVAYIENLKDLKELPPINDNWKPGDYTLVGVDNVALADEKATSYMRPPSTMYAVLPGTVDAIKFFGTGDVNSTDVPDGLAGVQLGTTVESDKKPVTEQEQDESKAISIQGHLDNQEIIPGTATYTSPEGIIYEDNKSGELVYSDKNNGKDGEPSVLEADIESYDAKGTQLYTIEEKTIGDNKGYAISCNGLYLTVMDKHPYKLYFTKNLTLQGLFLFINTDNPVSDGLVDVVTDNTDPKSIRPVEIICKSVIIGEELGESNKYDKDTGEKTEEGKGLISGVQNFLDKAKELVDENSDKSVYKMKQLVQDVKDALNESDADTATSLADKLVSTVDKVFASDTEKNKLVRDKAKEAKDAVNAAAADDMSSVQQRIEKVTKAYNALSSFTDSLESNVESLRKLADTIIAQQDALNVKGMNYEIYGRVTAYFSDSMSYAYASANKATSKQLWQIMETNKSSKPYITMFNSYYGLAMTQQDSERLRASKYIIDYENGLISGLPMMGSASYRYYSNNILGTLLKYFSVNQETYGVKGEDYFVYRYNIDESNFQDYYYVVTEEGKRSWSNPVWIMGTVGLATTDMIGGFLNVPDNALDGGYVKRNDEGYLQLVDYDLLRTGAAAYQLGEDVSTAKGAASDEIQKYLDEYVNARVAFPNSNKVASVEKAIKEGTTGIYAHEEVIHLTLNLSAEDAANTITVSDIDSRFGTCIDVHITGSANSNTTILFSNIEKLMIDNAIEYDETDAPNILIENCCLYYDASILNKISKCNTSLSSTGMSDIKFWYERYADSDAKLTVNDMTISEFDAPKITDAIDFWNATAPNDNHYHVALHSITFAGNGTIQGCGMLIANDTTSNIQDGHFITAANFELPQGGGLNYPERLLTKPLKVTGTFESGYMTDGGYVMQDTYFTAMTQAYDKYANSTTISGSILFHVYVNIIDADFGGVSTDGWETDTFHLFQGTAV